MMCVKRIVRIAILWGSVAGFPREVGDAALRRVFQDLPENHPITRSTHLRGPHFQFQTISLPHLTSAASPLSPPLLP